MNNERLLRMVRQYGIDLNRMKLRGVIDDQLRTLHTSECESGPGGHQTNVEVDDFTRVCDQCLPGLESSEMTSIRAYYFGISLRAMVEEAGALEDFGQVESFETADKALELLEKFQEDDAIQALRRSTYGDLGMERLGQYADACQTALLESLRRWTSNHQAEITQRVTGQAVCGPRYYTNVAGARLESSEMKLLVMAYTLDENIILVPSSVRAYLGEYGETYYYRAWRPSDTAEVLDALISLVPDLGLSQALEVARAL